MFTLVSHVAGRACSEGGRTLSTVFRAAHARCQKKVKGPSSGRPFSFFFPFLNRRRNHFGTCVYDRSDYAYVLWFVSFGVCGGSVLRCPNFKGRNGHCGYFLGVLSLSVGETGVTQNVLRLWQNSWVSNSVTSFSKFPSRSTPISGRKQTNNGST